MLYWPEDAIEISSQIASSKSLFKVALKTCNDPLLLQIWLDHYLGFLDPCQIIIADNRSTMGEVEEIYRLLPSEVVLFSYQDDPNNGFHNVIHNRAIFPDLYDAFEASCEFLIWVDTDELLVLLKDDSCLVSKTEFEFALTNREGLSTPSIWVDSIPGSTEVCYIGTDWSVLLHGLKWGKPFVPTNFRGEGYLIHNTQFPGEMFGEASESSFFLIHLKNFSRDQRLAVNKRKLIARRFAQEADTYEQIAARETFGNADPTVIRLVGEMLSILDTPTQSPQSHDLLASGTVRLRPGSKIEFGSDSTRAVFGSFRSGSDAMTTDNVRAEAVVTIPDNTRSGDVDLAKVEKLRQVGDFDNALSILLKGISDFPTLLDEYGDPSFLKETIRLMLSLSRWDEATALIPQLNGSPSDGWHHILFARALAAAGRKEDAASHWAAFAVNRPSHPEAIAALNGSISDLAITAPLEPRMSLLEKSLFENTLRGKKRFLEFGAGGSTVLAAKLSVTNIVSVESDKQWLSMLSKREELKGSKFTQFHVDIGKTKEWGFPADSASAINWPKYHQSVWDTLSWEPDFVLVDGRFRVACTLASICHCPPTVPIAIHDFWDRPYYHCVLKYLDTVERAENIGIFQTKKNVDWRALAIDLARYSLDPS